MPESPGKMVRYAAARLVAAISGTSVGDVSNIAAPSPRLGPDVSNYTYAPTAAWEAWIGQGHIDAIFPQALNPPAGYPPAATVQQVQWGIDHGLLVVPYIWKWFGTGIADIQRRLDILSPYVGQIHHLMLDVEDTTVSPLAALSGRSNEIVLDATFRVVEDVRLPPEHMLRLRRQPPAVYSTAGSLGRGPVSAMSLQQRVDELSAAFELLDTFPTLSGLPVGFYSGSWYVGPYLGNTTAFAGRPLWNALYDNNPDVTVWTPFGGWRGLAVKQFAGTQVFYGVGGVDMNALDDGYLQASDPGNNPPLDDPGWVAKKTAVVEAAGELQTVADQLDDVTTQIAALLDEAKGLAQGVRDRANIILS